jgi:F-type H+-transporting ATPase subunit a
MRPRAMVPGRFQAAAELAYETIMKMCVDGIGHEGKKFFPIVFTLFFFILFGNLIGVFPYFFTFTSHIAVTMAMSLFVFILVTVVALREHGLHFFSYFVPPGVPGLLIPLMVLIEVISYLSRIISLSVRLFANMMAGHILLVTFALLSEALFQAKDKILIPVGILPFFMLVFLTSFEVLVAFLQAYIFAMLTAVYIGGATHPEH